MVEVKTVTLPSGETKTVETGLSPGQTAGYVEGTYTVRPPGTEITQPYSPEVGSTSIMIEGGATAGRGEARVGETTIVRRDVYGNVIGIKQVSPTKETIFERRLTPGGGYVEEGLPYSVQPIYAEIERTRAEMPLYRQMATPAQVVTVPTPFQTGFVGQGGIYQAFEERRLQQQYPSTPIDYSRTHVSELYTWPIYKGAAAVSGGLQYGTERVIELFPEPQAQKEVQKGVGSLVTGIPEFFASGLAGFEYAAREPEVFKTGIVPAAKMFGAGLAEQAIQRPFYTGGQAIGMGIMLKSSPKISGIERMRLTSGKATPENVFFPERPGSLGRSSSLLPKSITESLRFPERERLPQRPAGTEGLELLKIPERSKISKPVVLEGVKSIRETSAIPEQYRAALERGAAPFAERGVMGIRFGSKGYRPTGVAKPENIFSTGEFKKFIKEEKAVSYVPTFERMKAEPQIKPRVSVMTAERTYVLPSLRNLQVVKTAPKTSFKIAVLPKTSTRTKVMTDILVQTRPKTFTQAMTWTSTRPSLRTKALTKTMVMPSTMARISVMPDIQTKTALKQLTQPQTRTITRTQIRTAFDIDVKKLTKQKTTSDIFGFGWKGRKGRRGGFKFPEMTRVATPSQIMKGFRL